MSGPTFRIDVSSGTYPRNFTVIRYTQASGYVPINSGVRGELGVWYSVIAAQLDNTSGYIFINGRQAATSATNYVFPGLVSGIEFSDATFNTFSVGAARYKNASTDAVTAPTTCDVSDVVIAAPANLAELQAMATAHWAKRFKSIPNLKRYYPLDKLIGDYDHKTFAVRLSPYIGTAASPTTLPYKKIWPKRSIVALASEPPCGGLEVALTATGAVQTSVAAAGDKTLVALEASGAMLTSVAVDPAVAVHLAATAAMASSVVALPSEHLQATGVVQTTCTIAALGGIVLVAGTGSIQSSVAVTPSTGLLDANSFRVVLASTGQVVAVKANSAPLQIDLDGLLPAGVHVLHLIYRDPYGTDSEVDAGSTVRVVVDGGGVTPDLVAAAEVVARPRSAGDVEVWWRRAEDPHQALPATWQVSLDGGLTVAATVTATADWTYAVTLAAGGSVTVRPAVRPVSGGTAGAWVAGLAVASDATPPPAAEVVGS